LRAYVVRRGDVSRVLESIKTRFRALHAVELVETDLCRPELLVEVEGLLVCTSPPQRHRVSVDP
jgi:hypothetical protein